MEEKIVIQNLEIPSGQMQYQLDICNHMLSNQYTDNLVTMSNIFYMALTALKN